MPSSVIAYLHKSDGGWTSNRARPPLSATVGLIALAFPKVVRYKIKAK